MSHNSAALINSVWISSSISPPHQNSALFTWSKILQQRGLSQRESDSKLIKFELAFSFHLFSSLSLPPSHPSSLFFLLSFPVFSSPPAFPRIINRLRVFVFPGLALVCFLSLLENNILWGQFMPFNNNIKQNTTPETWFSSSPLPCYTSVFVALSLCEVA